jgi:hypothetical protein
VNPVGRGRPVARRRDLVGPASISSGVDHAQWVMAAGHIVMAGAGLLGLVPSRDIAIIDIGMCRLAGSGSKTFEIRRLSCRPTAFSTEAADETARQGALRRAVLPPAARRPSLRASRRSRWGIAEGCLQAYYVIPDHETWHPGETLA